LICGALLLAGALGSAVHASRLEKKAVEIGPGITPPYAGGAALLETPDGVPEADAHGRLTIRLLLDKSGAVRRVVAPDGADPRLAAAAVARFENASFSPARRGNKPVVVWFDATVVFRPREELEAEIPGPGCVPAAYDLDRIEDPTEEVQLPRLVEKVDPDYPPELIAERASGMARFACVVDTCGHVRDCRVLYASRGAFARSALAAIVKRRYAPARRNGEAVTVRFTIDVTFSAS
jgi:TonB family protein